MNVSNTAQHNKLKALYDSGLIDREIAETLEIPTVQVWGWRKAIGLESNSKKRAAARQKAKESKANALREAITKLHAEGLTDRVMANRLNVTERHIRRRRSELGLPSVQALQRKEAVTRRRHRVGVLHEAGRTASEIAERLNENPSTVYADLRWFNLKPNPALPPEPVPPETQPAPSLSELHRALEVIARFACDIDPNFGVTLTLTDDHVNVPLAAK